MRALRIGAFALLVAATCALAVSPSVAASPADSASCAATGAQVVGGDMATGALTRDFASFAAAFEGIDGLASCGPPLPCDGAAFPHAEAEYEIDEFDPQHVQADGVFVTVSVYVFSGEPPSCSLP